MSVFQGIMYTFGGIPLLVVVWCGLAHTLDNLSLDEAWESWKITHRREYNGLVSSMLWKDWNNHIFFPQGAKRVNELGWWASSYYYYDYFDWNVLAKSLYGTVLMHYSYYSIQYHFVCVKYLHVCFTVDRMKSLFDGRFGRRTCCLLRPITKSMSWGFIPIIWAWTILEIW